jgi:enoyl-CoA hydratase
MAAALHAAFLAFDADPDSAVAILYGAGGTFCAGADLKAVAEGRGNVLAPVTLEAGVEPAAGPLGPTRLSLSKPIIAAIEGHAVAGGLELALWCDLRVVAEDGVLGVFCRRFGVPLIDGGTVRLPRLIGLSRALDLILTGRAVSAAEALNMGLVNRVVPAGTTLDAALALAEDLAAFPQACLRADLQAARRAFEGDLGAALAREFEPALGVLAADGIAGAARFAAGAGRGGRFDRSTPERIVPSPVEGPPEARVKPRPDCDTQVTGAPAAGFQGSHREQMRWDGGHDV